MDMKKIMIKSLSSITKSRNLICLIVIIFLLLSLYYYKANLTAIFSGKLSVNDDFAFAIQNQLENCTKSYLTPQSTIALTVENLETSNGFYYLLAVYSIAPNLLVLIKDANEFQTTKYDYVLEFPSGFFNNTDYTLIKDCSNGFRLYKYEGDLK